MNASTAAIDGGRRKLAWLSKTSIILIVLIVSLLITSIYAIAILVTNVVGPIEIHVSPPPEEGYATLTLVSAPSSASAGETISIVLSLTANAKFEAYPEVNITATDFTPTTSDVTVRLYRPTTLCRESGYRSMSMESIPNGVRSYTSYDTFFCEAGESGQFEIQISFNTPNPTPEGKYQIYIALKT